MPEDVLHSHSVLVHSAIFYEEVSIMCHLLMFCIGL